MPKAKAKNIALILLSPCGGFSISEKTSQTPESSSSFHYHEFSDVWSYDAEHHWGEATSGGCGASSVPSPWAFLSLAWLGLCSKARRPWSARRRKEPKEDGLGLP